MEFNRWRLRPSSTYILTITSAGLAGLLAGSVFAFGLPYFLILPALVILFHLTSSHATSKRKLKPPSTFLIGFVFFFVFHATVFSWFLDVDIGGLVAVGSLAAKGYALLSLVVMAAVLSMPMVSALHIAQKYLGHRYFPLYAGVAWIVGEWLRSLLFSLFLYGNGASIGDYWNFGSLGLAAMDSPFASSSQFIGLYGLTFITVLLAALLHKILLAKRRQTLIFASLAIILSASLPGIISKPDTDKTVPASVLQEKSNVPDLGSHVPIVNVSSQPKHLIVLPEYSSTYQASTETFTQQFINSRLGSNGVTVSVREPEPDNRFGRLVFRDLTGQIVDEQTKQLLIPTGEYMPYIVIALYRFTGQPEVVDQFEQTRRVQKGLPPRTFTQNDMSVGSVACSGILARDIFRQMSQDGANVLTNSASLLDFNHSQSYFRQSLQMARFHAIANSRTYVQSTVGAPAFVIGHDGKFIVEPTNTETKFYDFAFSPRSTKTIYTRIGEWPLLLSGLVVLAYLIWTVKDKKNARKT